jgi:hypothetical protein
MIPLKKAPSKTKSDKAIPETKRYITKREYFTAMAMTNFYVDREDCNALEDGSIPNFELTAKFCVAFADAIIKELEN